jgi:excinuclease ABC subunit C
MIKIPDNIDLKTFPDKPGVYIMRNAKKKIIYIGKAKNLKKRVHSYFQKNQKDPKTISLVSNILTIDYIVTDNEMEALILESNLIKKHKPKYNIMLKYGSGYPWIKVTLNEYFPRVFKSRYRYKDGAKYFGPYVSGRTLYEHLNVIHTLFPLKKCNRKLPLDLTKHKPCFNYHIKRCSGACLGKIDSETYKREYIDKVLLFLSGKYRELIHTLEDMMAEASTNLQFEKAAKLRDSVNVVKEVQQKQKVYIDESSDLDILGFFKFEDLIAVTILHIIEGKLIGKESFHFELKQNADELLEDFIARYYQDAETIPSEVLIGKRLDSEALLNDFLTKRRGKKATLTVPKIGQKRDLVIMANKNAKFSYKAEKKMTDKEITLVKLKNILGMEKEPRRIEGFDIGNLLGKTSYASCVSFFNGYPDKKNYRIFGIKSVDKPNDYESMREAVARRYQRLKNEQKQMPDLILIDGGKGQLNAAKSMLDALELDVPICSLAKKEEEIYLPGQSKPIHLEKNNDALRLLQSVRDEAHRFCNTFHKKQRDKKSLSSILNKINGVGERRRKALYKAFKSLDKIKNASVEELEKVGCIPKNIAENIYSFFHDE